MNRYDSFLNHRLPVSGGANVPANVTYVGTYVVSGASPHVYSAIPLGAGFARRRIIVMCDAKLSSGLNQTIALTADFGAGAIGPNQKPWEVQTSTTKVAMSASWRDETATTATFTATIGAGQQSALHVFVTSDPIIDAMGGTLSTNYISNLLTTTSGIAYLACAQASTGTLDPLTLYTTNNTQVVGSAMRSTIGHYDMPNESGVSSSTPISVATIGLALGFRGRATEQLDEKCDTSGLTTYTFSNVDLGAAVADRLIVVAVSWNSSSTSLNRSLNGITYDIGAGAVAMTRATRATSATSIANCEIFYATIPTGTTATFTATLNGAGGGMSWQVLRKTGLVSNVPANTAAANLVTSPATTIPVSAGSWVVEAVHYGNGLAQAISAPSLDPLLRSRHNGLGYFLQRNFTAANAAAPVGFTSPGNARLCAAAWN